EVTGLSEKALRLVRGRKAGLVPQDPTVSLNPVQRVGDQVGEALRVHGLADRRSARLQAVDLLEKAGLPDPAVRARQYPHELSGGMRQRVLIAIAIAAEPSLIIADEPTSALDATVQRRILDHLEGLIRGTGTGMLLVTHDLGVAADRADRLVVMSGGRVVETGRTADVLAAPRERYTRTLVGAAPGLNAVVRENHGPDREKHSRALIAVQDLVKEFRLPGGGALRAVDGVSFD